MKREDPTRYDWLRGEAMVVKWRSFFEFGDRHTGETVKCLMQQLGELPGDYLQFLVEFGGAKLFRSFTETSYAVVIDHQPVMDAARDGRAIVGVGFTSPGGRVFFPASGGDPANFSGIWEEHGLGSRLVGSSFSDWLKARFEREKRRYSKLRWKAIVDGPVPFTSRELEMVDALPLFNWRPVGCSAAGNLLVEVTNPSKLTLNCITIGVKAPRLDGAVALDVSDVHPGQTAVVECDCYRELVDPRQVKLVRLPIPRPEDRESYFEFRENLF